MVGVTTPFNIIVLIVITIINQPTFAGNYTFFYYNYIIIRTYFSRKTNSWKYALEKILEAKLVVINNYVFLDDKQYIKSKDYIKIMKHILNFNKKNI